MHVRALTDVDHIFVFDQGRKYLKERANVKEFRSHIQVWVVPCRNKVTLLVSSNPSFITVLDPIGQLIISFEDDYLILAWDLILGNYLHDHILVDIVPLVIKNNNNSQKVK